jgi:hypothetical protein
MECNGANRLNIAFRESPFYSDQAMISPTFFATSAGEPPYPASTSAVSGTRSTRAMRAVAATTSGHGAASPSGPAPN